MLSLQGSHDSAVLKTSTRPGSTGGKQTWVYLGGAVAISAQVSSAAHVLLRAEAMDRSRDVTVKVVTAPDQGALNVQEQQQLEIKEAKACAAAALRQVTFDPLGGEKKLWGPECVEGYVINRQLSSTAAGSIGFEPKAVDGNFSAMPSVSSGVQRFEVS